MRLAKWLLAGFALLAFVFVPMIQAQTTQPPPVTVNAMIVAALTWVVTAAFKKWKPIPNDTLPWVAYWVSQVAAYAGAVIQGVIAGTATVTFASVAWAQEIPGAASAAAANPDTIKAGAISFALVSIWDLLARKLLWGKVFDPLMRKLS